MESSERDTVMSAPREVPIRESAPPSAARPFARAHEPAWSNAVSSDPRNTGADVWAGAISRLQTQVSLNTSMLESHRRQLQDVNLRIDSLKHEMGGVAATLHDFRMELRAKGSSAYGRHDPGDLDVLIGQVEAVTAKANEIDSMKLQLDLMKNRMKRFEELGSAAVLQPRPGTSASSSQKDATMHEGPPSLSHNSPYPPPHHGPPHHHPLPPMRTASMASPGYPSASHPPPAGLESHGRPSYPPPIEPRHFSADSSAIQGSPASGFRPGEPLPPPSALPGWRSSDSLPHLTGLPPGPPASARPRPTTMEPEPHASGWASVNAAQPVKRPFEEPRASPYESPGSPKRPKLAPIMPRSTHVDDPYAASVLGPSVTTDSSIHARSRAGSDASQSQVSSVPASTGGPAYRFITSTTQADPHEGWQREHERRRHHQHGHGHGHGHGGTPGHGRRGGRRGGRGGRRARGGGVILAEPRAPGSPEWEPSEGPGGEVPPNGYHHHHHGHPYSPVLGRGGMVRRSGGFAGGRSDREGEPPETPTHGGEDTMAFEAGDGGQMSGSGGKKTRTKPIRNADGVLIRKDGRPDMRSVSSANNLRKVHAKKEAERAEMEGKTPTSTRSLAPMQPYSEDDENAMHSGTPGTPQDRDEVEEEYEDDDRDSPENTQDRSTAVESVADRYFPKAEAPAAETKSEHGADDSRGAVSESSRPTTDVEMGETQAAEQRDKDQDTRMATVEESNEERGDAGAG